jgi:hypothetical protein
MRRTLLCTFAFAVFALPANAYTDAKSGLGITPPTPFVVGVAQAPPADTQVMLAIKSSTGRPAGVDATGAVCVAVYKLLPQNNPLTQDQLNTTVQNPDFINLMKANLQLNYDVSAINVVENGAVKGYEAIATVKKGPMAGMVSGYLVTFETPKGRTGLSCHTPKAQFDAALPQFKQIRESIQLPN